MRSRFGESRVAAIARRNRLESNHTDNRALPTLSPKCPPNGPVATNHEIHPVHAAEMRNRAAMTTNHKPIADSLRLLASNLKRLRRAKGYTQWRLGKLCGLSCNCISNIEQETVNVSLPVGASCKRPRVFTLRSYFAHRTQRAVMPTNRGPSRYTSGCLLRASRESGQRGHRQFRVLLTATRGTQHPRG